MRRLRLLSAARDDFIDPRLLRFYARDPACICARLALVELAEPSSRKPERWQPLARACLKLSTEFDLPTAA